MNPKRVNQIAEEIKKIISELLRYKIKDPRISDLTSITEVRLTNDLSYAKVYVSVFGSEEEKDNAILGLKSAEGFIKKEINKSVKLRIMPQLQFVKDTTLDEALKLEELIKEAHKNEGRE